MVLLFFCIPSSFQICCFFQHVLVESVLHPTPLPKGGAASSCSVRKYILCLWLSKIALASGLHSEKVPCFGLGTRGSWPKIQSFQASFCLTCDAQHSSLFPCLLWLWLLNRYGILGGRDPVPELEKSNSGVGPRVLGMELCMSPPQLVNNRFNGGEEFSV